MADLDSLLNKPSGDVKTPVPPAGTYKVIALSARLSDPDVDKNGNDYVMARFRVKFREAVDVPNREALDEFVQQDGFEQVVLNYSEYIANESHAEAVIRKLAQAGLRNDGASLKQLLTEVRGAGLEFEAEVSINAESGRPQVDRLYVPRQA